MCCALADNRTCINELSKEIRVYGWLCMNASRKGLTQKNLYTKGNKLVNSRFRMSELFLFFICQLSYCRVQ